MQGTLPQRPLRLPRSASDSDGRVSSLLLILTERGAGCRRTWPPCGGQLTRHPGPVSLSGVMLSATSQGGGKDSRATAAGAPGPGTNLLLVFFFVYH